VFDTITYLTFGVAAIHQIFAISTVFSNPKLAGEIGTFFITLASLGYFGVIFSE
jgi:hypothetical protein